MSEQFDEVQVVLDYAPRAWVIVSLVARHVIKNLFFERSALQK